MRRRPPPPAASFSSAETNTGPGSSITGKVASIGAEVKGVKAGDKVLVNGFSGSDVEFGDGSKGKFITMEDVIAVIANDGAIVETDIARASRVGRGEDVDANTPKCGGWFREEAKAEKRV